MSWQFVSPAADNQLYLHRFRWKLMLEKYELQQFMMKTDHCLFENPMRIPQLRRFTRNIWANSQKAHELLHTHYTPRRKF